MSTTVTYKGSTLTTVENATKTLKTAGKYMEGDVIVTDVTAGGGAISITEETDSGGGTIVHINSEIVVSGTKSITSNGTYDVTEFASAEVNVPTGGTINNQNKTVNPTTSQQQITADSGYTGLGTVTVTAMPTMTLPTSASSTSSGTSKATIGRSTSNQYINIPTGYNSSAAYYTVSAVANGSATAPASISGTSASVTTGTNTLTLSKTVSVTPSVSAGYISSGTAGNSSVSLTASVTTKAAATITPGTSNQTIASGTYLTGTQTISGDANLVGSNILSGKSIFGVAGSVAFQTYYTGSSAPSSSLGVNGDIYLQT